MTLVSTNGLLGARSIEAIAGAGSLFSQPGGLSADAVTTQLAALIPLDLLGVPEDAAQAQPAVDQAVPIAALTDLVGTASPLALLAGAGAGGSLSAAQPGALIEALGQSLADLGHDGNQTLVADVTNLPGEVTGLNTTTGNVADALYNLGAATTVAGNFVNDVADTVTGVGDRPLGDTANKVILDFHELIEFTTHDIGLTYVTHGVTNLGETIGLGKIGAADNLVTDVLNLPGTLLSGGDVLGAVTHLTDHVGDLANGVSGIVNAIPLDLGSDPLGLGILGPDGIVGDLTHVGDLLNPAGGGPLGAVGGLVDNVTNVLDLVGSNSDGGGNLVTDVLKLPGELLSGNGTPSLTDAGHQLDVTLTAAGDLVGNVLGAGEGGIGQSPNGLIGSISQSLDAFGDTGGAAVGIPLAIDGLVATTQALGLGGGMNAAGGLLAGVSQTVEGALKDLGNDAALAGLGGGIAIPSLGGLGADGLVGSLTQPAEGGAGILAPVTDLLHGDGGDAGLLGTVTSLLDPDHHGQQGGGLGHALGLL